MKLAEEKKLTILVVDDEPAFQATLCEVLQEEGFIADGAGNGQIALDYLHSHIPPSLIVLDLMMPVMDGFKFLEEKQKDPKLQKIPTIMLTAGRISTIDIFREEVFGFLKKPFKLDLFLQLVNDAIENKLHKPPLLMRKG